MSREVIKPVFLLTVVLLHYRVTSTGSHAFPRSPIDAFTTTTPSCVVWIVWTEGVSIFQSLGIFVLEADQVRIFLCALEVTPEEGVVDRYCTTLFIIP
jgi:hypothetical protein